MKVTFCTYDDANGIGGPNPWLRRLLPALQKYDIEPHVLFMTLGAGPYPTVEAIQRLGIPFSQIACPMYSEQAVRWILKQLTLNRPDIFVPNLITSAYFATRWIREAGIPTVGVIHSDDAHYRGIMAEFLGSQPAFQLSGVACCSKYLEQQVHAKQTQGITTRWLPYGAPISLHVAQSPTSALRLIYAGRLVEEQKRISEVTWALCTAVRQVPGTEAFLYGDGWARPTVEKILSEDGSSLPVHLMGRVDSDKIQKEIVKSHVFVLLSDYEGLPIALMEAMACGVVPICLHMQSGIPELIEDNVTGLLVSNRDDDFINAVRRLREEAGLWERLSKACREKIVSEYSSEICAKNWVQFLREIEEKSYKNSPIVVPKRVELPSAHPDLLLDERMPSFCLCAYLKLRSVLGSLKQRLVRAIKQ